MLWYKSWLEMRTRLLIGLALLLLSALGSVIVYPELKQVAPLMRTDELVSEFGRQIQESVEFTRTYRGYVWSQLLAQKQVPLMSLFAALLGAGGVVVQSGGQGTLFTLALPVLRTRLLAVRAATGLLGLLVLAFVPMLGLVLLSPAIGESYLVWDALAHGLCLFVAAAALFSLALLLSTLFSDIWRPLLLTLVAAMLLRLLTSRLIDAGVFNLSGIMTGEIWFRNGGLPWGGLIACLLASAMFLSAAALRIKRRDF